MFTEAQKNAYQTLTAPEELRARVMTLAEQSPAKSPVRKTPRYRAFGAAMAACLLLVMGAALYAPRDAVTITASHPQWLDETMTLSEEGVASARALRPSLCVELTLRCEEETALAVTDGFLCNDAGETVDFAAAGETTIFWQVDADEEQSYALTAADTVLQLYFDRAQECWVVTEE